MTDAIEIIGADANNLRDVDIAIPRNALTAIVGVSGSGKSSLVEDTIAAVAAERMKRFLDIDLPALRGKHVDAFIGALPPMLFAGQRAFRASVRTTLGTSTGLLRILRRLFVRFSEPYADDVGEPVPEASPETFAAWLERYSSGKATIWASPVIGQRTDGVAAVEALRKAGVEEIVVRSETDRGARGEEGTRTPLARFKPLRKDVRHWIEARIAEVNLGKVTRPAPLEEQLRRAWSAAPGATFVELHDDRRPELRTAFAYALDARVHRVHPGSPIVYANADRHRLSFNAPGQLESGACPACGGTGVATGVDEKALVAHLERSLHEGALALWTPKNYRYVNIQHVTIEGLRGREGFDPDVPWRDLPPLARSLILEGASDRIQGIDPKTKKKSGAPMVFPGFRRAIAERVARGTSATKELKVFVGEGPCSACGGTRWSVQARALRVAGWSIDRLLALPLCELESEARGGSLVKKAPAEARSLVANVARVAASMVSVGLGHLSGERGMLDVSDGESRRARLAGVLTSRLAGLLLVLDEPARGLHEQDLVTLGDALLDATRLHTVIVSEHRQRIIARADHLVELGPGAGPDGGTIVFEGPVTGTHWAKLDRIPVNARALPASTKWLQFQGVSIHNVEKASVRIPLRAVTCIAGVSGSGKSSFARGALVPALAAALPKDSVDADDFRTRRGSWSSVKGAEHVQALYALDQAPAGANKRSLVMTFLDMAEGLRRAYADQPASRKLGFRPADFSINGGGGRCPRCLGIGALDDGEECPVCGGLRFGIDALSVQVDGLSYSDLLQTPVDELLTRELPPAVGPELLRTMAELGVGHLALGRSLDTLSGGEVQRLRIARALAKHKVRDALFVLDEPAGGLHPSDVKRLDGALRHIVDNGNTVVLVEHDPHLLSTCDHIVEFGPGSGPEGGRVIATGSPDEIADQDTPTGRALHGLSVSKRQARSHAEARISVATTRAAALRARAEIRQILGDDVEVPDDDDDEVISPAATADPVEGGRRAIEIADLDSALVSVLLDSLQAKAQLELQCLAESWDTEVLHVVIQPLLDAIATWGPRVPRSVIEEAQEHRAAMGLDWAGSPKSPLEVRATGPRFDARGQPGKRLAVLRDALSVGSGYLELVDERGRVHERVSERLMDLDAGLVGPRHATPAHFRRLDRGGACPMCLGKTVVASFDHDLLVSRRSGKVLDDASLDPRAAAILKGVWRSEAIPFFRRLAEEGLWDASARWDSLEHEAEMIALHGFWIRPSHGTFLKPGSKFDGSEVGHWLRWDGLVKAVDAQLDRSKDAAWRQRVEGSRRDAKCPLCRGSGLAPHAALLKIGKKTLDQWVRDGRLDDLLEAVQGLPDRSPRAARERKRALSCLAPLRKTDTRVSAPAPEAVGLDVFRRAAEQFEGAPPVAK